MDRSFNEIYHGVYDERMDFKDDIIATAFIKSLSTFVMDEFRETLSRVTFDDCFIDFTFHNDLIITISSDWPRVHKNDVKNSMKFVFSIIKQILDDKSIDKDELNNVLDTVLDSNIYLINASFKEIVDDEDLDHMIIDEKIIFPKYDWEVALYFICELSGSPITYRTYNVISKTDYISITRLLNVIGSFTNVNINHYIREIQVGNKRLFFNQTECKLHVLVIYSTMKYIPKLIQDEIQDILTKTSNALDILFDTHNNIPNILITDTIDDCILNEIDEELDMDFL